jgi:hypothetical protein
LIIPQKAKPSSQSFVIFFTSTPFDLQMRFVQVIRASLPVEFFFTNLDICCYWSKFSEPFSLIFCSMNSSGLSVELARYHEDKKEKFHIFLKQIFVLSKTKFVQITIYFFCEVVHSNISCGKLNIKNLRSWKDKRSRHLSK